jgi:hypothetical protein
MHREHRRGMERGGDGIRPGILGFDRHGENRRPRDGRLLRHQRQREQLGHDRGGLRTRASQSTFHHEGTCSERRRVRHPNRRFDVYEHGKQRVRRWQRGDGRLRREHRLGVGGMVRTGSQHEQHQRLRDLLLARGSAAHERHNRAQLFAQREHDVFHRGQRFMEQRQLRSQLRVGRLRRHAEPRRSDSASRVEQ